MPPIIKDLPIPYQQQIDAIRCGPACAQMVLGFLGSGPTDQIDLYDNHCHLSAFDGTNWLSAPDGLQGTINDHLPAAAPSSFAVVGDPSGDAISRRIVWTIYNYGIPAVFLKWGQHWVVVKGVEVSAAPAGPTDTTYSLSSIIVNDPALPEDIISPREAIDDHVPYSTWKSEFLGPVSSWHWAGDIVAICDSAPVPKRVSKTPPSIPVPAKRLSGERIVTPVRATRLALAGVEEYGLLGREDWRESFIDIRPGTPMLVQRLDRRDTFYYIVPMQIRKGYVRAYVRVDARFGNYLQSMRVRGVGDDAFFKSNIDAKAAMKMVIGKTIDLYPKGKIHVREEAYSLYPTLVWRPCRESMSPYVPFYMITVGDDRIYVRVDGKVFTKLHLRDKGI